VAKKYRTALIISGLVTFIATYHYFRIFNSWVGAFDVKYVKETDGYLCTLSGQPFNDAYRYVDWLLTVPLLLMELIFVMDLPAEETVQKAWRLGVGSGLMVALGYPGEVQNGPGARLQWWAFAMIPFTYVVYSLVYGLEAATAKMSPAVASKVRTARWLTAISWLTYPFVYLVKTGPPGPTPTSAEQIGYSIADVVAKAVFGVYIWSIANTKSKEMEATSLLKEAEIRSMMPA
jgi:bacteriorhodopsin